MTYKVSLKSEDTDNEDNEDEEDDDIVIESDDDSDDDQEYSEVKGRYVGRLSSEVFKLLNDERVHDYISQHEKDVNFKIKDADVVLLKKRKSLNDAATVRARELYVQDGDIRPNGQAWNTVSEDMSYEIRLHGNYDTAQALVAEIIDAYQDIVLDSSYTHMAVATFRVGGEDSNEFYAVCEFGTLSDIEVD